MKNIKLILAAVSLSLVSFNIAFATTPGSTLDSKAKAPSTVWTSECKSCLTTNECISTNPIQNNAVLLGSDNNVQTGISSSCMQQSCANECSEAISKLNNAQ